MQFGKPKPSEKIPKLKHVGMETAGVEFHANIKEALVKCAEPRMRNNFSNGNPLEIPRNLGIQCAQASKLVVD